MSKSQSSSSLRMSFNKNDKVPDSRKIKCSACNKMSVKTDNFQQCNHCKLFYHHSCLNLSEAEVEDFKGNKDLLYFCGTCVGRTRCTFGPSQAFDMDALLDNINVNLKVACENMLGSVKSEVIELKEACRKDIREFIENNDISDLKKQVKDLADKLNSNQEPQIGYQTSNHQTNDMARLNRLNNVIINGIPNSFDNVSTSDAIIEFCSILDVQISIYDISYWRRISSHNKNQSPVVVSFVRRFTKEHVLHNYFQFIKKKPLSLSCLDNKLPNSRVFFDEHLTKENSTLFYLARQLKRKEFVFKVFVHQGLVFVVPKAEDKPLLVKDAADLDIYNKE